MGGGNYYNIGNHTLAVQRGLSLGVGLFICLTKPTSPWFSSKQILSIGYTPVLLSSNFFSVVLQAIFKNISQHFVKVFVNKLFDYITHRFKILLENYPFLYRCVNNYISAFNFLTGKVLCYIENTLKKKNFINYTIIYLYSEYLIIMEGKLSLNVFLIITWFVCYFNDYYQFYLILLSFSVFKCYLEYNTSIINSYPKLYKILLKLNSVIITGLILYFMDCIWIEVIIPFVKYIWNILKMESNNNNGNLSTDPNLGKIPGKEPNTGPNKPPVSLSEEKEKKLEKKKNAWKNQFKELACKKSRSRRKNTKKAGKSGSFKFRGEKETR